MAKCVVFSTLMVLTMQAVSASSVISLTNTTFANHALKSKGVFVKFFAPWCGHCQEMAPEWEKLSQLASDSLIIAEVDCTQQAQLCEKEGVVSFPTLLAFPIGTDESHQYQGERTYEAFKVFIDKGGLSPVCSSEHKEACSEEDLQTLQQLEALGENEVAKRLKEHEAVLKAADEELDAFRHKLYAQYETLQSKIEDKKKELKPMMRLLKQVSFTVKTEL